MMSEKQKNLITRSIFGALFVAIMVLGFTRPHYMVVLFAVITGMTLWEFSGLVNDQKGISVNRFISTAAGVYFFVAVAGQRTLVGRASRRKASSRCRRARGWTA